jgi:RNA 2',3'-cyclic 3'-phosphodiesterase
MDLAASAAGGAERLFFALPLPDDTRLAIDRAVRDGLGPAPGARVPPEANLHLTLRFLGHVDQDLKSGLVARARSLSSIPFTLGLGGWGAFPNPARATVAWIGVIEPSGALAALARELEDAARAVGLRAEERPYHPHVTVARFRVPTDLRDVLANLPPIGLAVPVDHFTLVRSVLGGGPPRYETLAALGLAGRPTR